MRLVATLAAQRLVPHSGFGNAPGDKIDVKIAGIKARSEAIKEFREELRHAHHA
jgi:hypothetical protein